MGSLSGIDPESAVELVTQQGKQLYKVSQQPFVSTHTVSFLNHGMAHILELVNRILLSYMESGILPFMWQVYLDGKKKTGRQNAKKRMKERKQYPTEVQDSQQEGGAEIWLANNYLLGPLLGISTIVFSLEITCRACVQRCCFWVTLW